MINPALAALPGDAYKVAHILLDMAGDQPLNVRSAEVAEYFGMSLRATQRVISTLVEAGILTVIVRGTYQVLARDESNVARVAPDMARNSSVYLPTTQTTSHAPTDSKESVVGGAAPVKGIEVIKETTVARWQDDGDDIGGVGFIGERPQPKSKAVKQKPQKFRNLVPREQWTMDDVVADFRQRVSQAYLPTTASWHDLPNLRGNHTGGNSLMFALKVWAKEGLTPQDCATLLDQFFADSRETAKISNDFPAYKLFLSYIQRNIDTLRGKQASLSTAYIEHLQEQEVSWFKK
jgi:hypothetical protein